MGTRNLTIVKLGEKIFGQYGQWDGYPEGQGATVHEFVAKTLDLELFKKQFEKTRLLTGEEVQARWDEAKAISYNKGNKPASLEGFVTFADTEEFKKSNAHLDRDIGAEILEYIQKAEKPEVHDSLDFAADSLFCEWAYLLDLDAQKLLVFKGFNKEPLAEGEFFKYLESKTHNEYHPVKLHHTLTFDELKGMDSKAFLKSFPKEEDEEELTEDEE